ncbi:hypothetical protein BOTCAL_0116g00200 [Botryotinia calthae]|uniref:Uncharacterized protein n=1 Tax=Botryotinia calthae TaxID=38488 RepID=A0A4Y8D709_9HELO|nr:hypothetical protein BOTCAL_0116g00200 [Botryotinia calthae]
MDNTNEEKENPEYTTREIIGNLNRKVEECFVTRSHITLSAKEAHWLNYFCRNYPPGPKNIPKDTEVFQALTEKASEAANSSQSLWLTAREIEAYKLTGLRDSFYDKSPSKLPIDDILLWFQVFREIYIDGTHCLDYQWDPFKDYSKNVGLSLSEEFSIASKPCFNVPGGREELAKEWYLFSLSSYEKLKDAMLWQVDVTLNSREAHVLSVQGILLPISKEVGARIPGNASRKLQMEMASFDPENVLPQYLFQLLNRGPKNKADVTFTSDEAATLLIILKVNPVPKSDPSIEFPQKAVEYHDGNHEIPPPEWVSKAIEAQVKAGQEEPKRFENGYPLTTKTPEQRQQWRQEEKDRLISLGHTELAVVRKYPKEKMIKSKVTIKEIKAVIETKAEESSKAHEESKEEAEDRANVELILSFGRRINAKERQIADKETEMKHLRNVHENREESLRAENNKLESALATAKEKLDKALKEPDKVRSEWSAKIQRLHEKVSRLEQELEAEQDAHNITKLDSAETTNKLSRHKAAHERFVTKATELKRERDEARQERDRLRVSRVSQAQLDDTKASEIARAVEESTKPLKTTINASEANIATLEIKIAKLKNDKRMKRSQEAVAANQKAQELNHLKARHGELSETLLNERNGRAQDAISRKKIESDLQRQLQEQKRVSANLQSQIMRQSDGDQALLDQLALLQARNTRLEDENSQFRTLQSMMQEIGRSQTPRFV